MQSVLLGQWRRFFHRGQNALVATAATSVELTWISRVGPGLLTIAAACTGRIPVGDTKFVEVRNGPSYSKRLGTRVLEDLAALVSYESLLTERFPWSLSLLQKYNY